MKMASRLVMRISLLLMVFHFLAPQTFSDTIPEFNTSEETVHQAQTNAIATPVLLKENDEKKFEANAIENAHVALLDLTAHGLNLQARHATEIFYFHSETLFSARPPLFTILRTFII